MRIVLAGLTLIVAVAISGCDPPQEEIEYVEDVKLWRTMLERSMASEDSYLKLAGLFELNPAESTFGTAEDSTFRVEAKRYDSAADTIGTFVREGESIEFRPSEGADILDDSLAPIDDPIEMVYEGETVTKLRHATYSWTVIKRGTVDPQQSALLPTALSEDLGVKYYVRVWDSKMHIPKSYRSLKYFPIDPAWRFEGVYHAYDEPRVFYQKNVQGLVEETPTTGVVVFTRDGVEYELETADEGDNLFIVFGDHTNGRETWGGGRFMDIPKPEDGATVIVDFNKTRNPWCAYTPYSTCPLPTKQNTLPFAVWAGALKPPTSGK